LHINLQQDQRTHNLPTAEEIAVIIPEEGVHHALNNRDMVLQARGGQLEQISQNSPLYSALHYVLLFPKGENGWYPRIPICGAQLREQEENTRQRDGEKHACSQMVSDTCYYAYYLHVRDSHQPPLFYGEKLFQQFVVNCHNLAKWLSHYLYFFFFFSFLWTYNYKVEHGKVLCDFVTMSQWCDK